MANYTNASRAPYSFYAVNEAGQSVRLTAEPGRAIQIPEGFKVNESPMFKHAISSGRLVEGDEVSEREQQEVVDVEIQKQADERRAADEALAKQIVAGISGSKAKEAEAETEKKTEASTSTKPATQTKKEDK